MSTRPVSAQILTPTGDAREGLRIDFHATDPMFSAHAVTDAGGVFVVDLTVGMTYRVPVGNAATVNGVAHPSGTVFIATVPVGEGPVDLGAIAVAVEDWSLPAIAVRFAALQTAMDALTARVAALEVI